MDAVPNFAWLACAGAASILMVELVLWYKLNPLMLHLMLLPHSPKRPPPKIQDMSKLRDFAGNGFTISWRFDRDARAILFRRRMTMGRKAYVTGAIRFARDGTPTVGWAPSPITLYPLLPALMLPIVYIESGQSDPVFFAVAMTAGAVLVGGINMVGAWIFLKNTGLPEMQKQLEDWIS